MAQALGTQSKGSVNVELNIVPFIDLMSCLTAFLLVTAVWINLAHLHNEPAGRGREHPGDDEPKKLSILIEYDRMVVSTNDTVDELRAGDWSALQARLEHFAFEDGKPHVEIAAASTNAHPIEYQTLIAAMDTTVKAGYPDVGVTDPAALSR